MAKKKNNLDYAKALYEVAAGLKGEKLNRVLKDFARVLVRDHRIKQADRIIAEFERYAKKQEGIVEAKILSARPLKTETLNKLKKVLGKEVEETLELDEELLGGVVVMTDDKILDASLKTKLKNLQLQLSNHKN